MTKGGWCLTIFITLLSFVAASSVYARVSGPCANCHTMHNSQNGSVVDADGTNKYLLNMGSDPCIACHTGTNQGGGSSNGTTPYVFSETPPNYGVDTLAGGNFYWVTKDDSKGHNCLNITGMSIDDNLTTAPGGPVSGGSCAECHDRITDCESCHTARHHADDTQSYVVGASGGFYRFLNSSAHGNNSTGVKGIEDDDWEYTVSASDHNEYAGSVDLVNSDVDLLSDDYSMSAYCAGCHDNFHGTSHTNNDTSGGSPWLLHPTGYALSDTAAGKEYHNYNNGNGYSPLAPIARDQDRLITMTGPSSTVYVTVGLGDGDQVMCLSCHRAHGSPYADMLRWDYNACDAGSANATCGCFVCHTSKDE